MAVLEQTPLKEYVGNGVTTNFALGFTCDLKQELKVFINDIEPELSTWSLTGGSVVFATAPALGSKIAFKRATKLERTTNYSSVNNSFRPEAINKDFDRVWHALQDQSYKLGQYDFDYSYAINTSNQALSDAATAQQKADSAYNLADTINTETRPIERGGTGATTAAGARTNLDVMSSSEVATAIASATPNATETVAGVVGLVNNLTSTDTTKALTAAQGKALNDKMFGVGQTYQDVTSSRVLGTTYTNTTNKDIWVSVSVSLNAGASLSAFVDGQRVCNGFAQQSSSQAWAGLLVPPNRTYSVSGSGIVKWMERK